MVRRKSPQIANNIDAAVDVIQLVASLAPLIDQLPRAPQPLMDWAAKMKSERVVPKLLSSMADRIGPRSLEDRIGALRSGIDLLLSADDAAGRLQILSQIDRLEHAVRVSEGLPLVKRRAARSHIDRQVDILERGLIDALLPKV